MTTARTGEDRITWFAWLIQQPCFQDGNDIRSQRSASHLSAFAKATDVGACAEHHILAPESGQFAVAQTRLNRYKKQRSVAVADPRSYVRRPYQSGGLALGQKLNRAVLAALGWNCKNALTQRDVRTGSSDNVAQSSKWWFYAKILNKSGCLVSGNSAFFFSATRSVADEIGEMFNFNWAAYLGLRELWWQVRAYKNTFSAIGMADVEKRFLSGMKLPGGVDLKKTILNKAWEAHESEFAKAILFEACTIYECWLEEVCSIAFSKKTGDTAALQLQFPLGSLDRNGNPNDYTLAIAKANNGSNLSSLMKDEFFPGLKVHGLNCYGDLNIYLMAYRFFKECRNSYIHSSGVATQKLVDTYTALKALAGWPSLPFNHQIQFPEPVKGQKIVLLLEDCKLFATLVHRMIVTLDAALCVTKRSQTWLKRSLEEHIAVQPKHKWANLSPNPSKRQAAVKGLLKGTNMPKPLNVAPIEAWLTADGII